MTIVRSPRTQREFTIISNSVCMDPRLSMRSLGLLVRLLSRPDNWSTNSETLAREFGCGREQIRSVLRELSTTGYMTLVKSQDAKGQWSQHWMVFDEPKDIQPVAGEPEPGNPYVGRLGAITSTDITSTDSKPVAAPAAKRSSRKCPKDYAITQDMIEWAEDKAPDVDINAELEKLKDYTYKTAMTDWDGAFRNWLRKAQLDAQKPWSRNGKSAGDMSDIEAMFARAGR